MDKKLANFHEKVASKYYLYNELFLALPFGGTEQTGNLLSIFSKYCADEIQKNKPPQKIIEVFFKKMGITNKKEIIKFLFKMLQFIERQIVLFDALEDAAFADTHDLTGPGSLKNLLTNVVHKHQQTAFIKQITKYQIKIVLTAHPTQFYPDTILSILAQLNSALHKNDQRRVSQLLLQLGKTSFKHQKKPTPYQEAQNLIWYLENIFYHIIPKIQYDINHALIKYGYKGKQNFNNIELGFWPGGDRDGNPMVTYQTTIEVAQLLKSRILHRYVLDMHQLEKKLTFTGIIAPLIKIKLKLEETYLSSQLTTFKIGIKKIYQNSIELIYDLNYIKKLLIKNHNSLFLKELDEFIIKVKCFNFYFAPMDMRENAIVHRKVFKLILDDLRKPYVLLSHKDKEAFLIKLIKEKVQYKLSKQQKNRQLINTVKSIAAIRNIQLNNGEKSLSRYVISNTSSSLDILELLALFYMVGKFDNNIPIDIIPLFESINDLENAETIMKNLYECDIYQQHLQYRNNTQIIMLGFSDGTKDGGYVAANWSIYKAKLLLTAISKKYKINVVFFDGRGGPPARGGGNTREFYRSLGSKIFHQKLQLTVQGQTISINFGNKETAKYNIEQLFTSGLEDLIFPDMTNDLTSKQAEIIEKLSQESMKKYLALKEDKLFIPYLEEMTPLRFYGDLNIGSRPMARHKSKYLNFSDLRAIPFVGSWSQLKQNVPGYYGFGFALNKLIEQGKTTQLMQLYQHSLFFKTLVENTMMSLSKSFFPLTNYIKNDKKFGHFWTQLISEAKLTNDLLLMISRQNMLLEKDDINRESIKLREEIVLPLLIIQQYAMVKFKGTINDAKMKATYKKIIIKALAANTNASRNSA